MRDSRGPTVFTSAARQRAIKSALSVRPSQAGAEWRQTEVGPRGFING